MAYRKCAVCAAVDTAACGGRARDCCTRRTRLCSIKPWRTAAFNAAWNVAWILAIVPSLTGPLLAALNRRTDSHPGDLLGSRIP